MSCGRSSGRSCRNRSRWFARVQAELSERVGQVGVQVVGQKSDMTRHVGHRSIGQYGTSSQQIGFTSGQRILCIDGRRARTIGRTRGRSRRCVGVGVGRKNVAIMTRSIGTGRIFGCNDGVGCWATLERRRSNRTFRTGRRLVRRLIWK